MTAHLTKSARDARQALLRAGMIAVKAEEYESLHRLARQADKLAAEVERLRKVQAEAFGVLQYLNVNEMPSEGYVEGLRAALREATR